MNRHITTTNGELFYISYNFGDRYIYGTDTTAIVIGQMQRFFIYEGNKFNELKSKSLKDLLKYIEKNESRHKMSDKYNRKDCFNVLKSYKKHLLKYK